MTKTKTSKKPAPKASYTPTTVPMTKAAILAEIADKAGITKAQAKAAYDTLLAIASAGAKKIDGITLPGFVKLRIGHRRARIGHNPYTGETIRITAREVVKANVLKAFNDIVLKKTPK